ncbi:PucR family transcriptional regulator [Actinomadura craniellae]|uniref:PucR family transcriptional regulator n=1 Tax=Actinomadura craniellae TaxID=2231787 RepID=A0A365GW56_9ACTN|nr:helix-turn-helix domain-containing protein [Actinomadura craniellae]RAY11040.1 PucR family transcriptional regulator [Actinomadura craniellae]
MTRTFQPRDVADPACSVTRQFAPLMRAELPSLAEEIIAEIRRAIPEYARSVEGPYGQALRLGVGGSLAAFVDQIAGVPTNREGTDDIFRRLGRFEAEEGRSLDYLQAAYRIGGQVAWRRIMKVAPRYDVSSAVMSRLADALFHYLDRLAALSLDGYLEAKAGSVAALDERRRRLLRLLLGGPTAQPRAVAELAESAGWPPPREVTLVAAEPGARYSVTALAPDLLLDFKSPEPHLLMPGPADTVRRDMLRTAIPDHRIAVGLTVPIDQAADSLRWARQALALTRTGVLGDGRLVDCEDHLVKLWLLSDPALIEQLARRRLDVLDGLTPGRRDRLTETLRAWMIARGTATEMADRLHVHPQTVRYRMRKIQEALGEQLEDPDARFEIEIALRAMQLHDRMKAASDDAGPMHGT